MQNVMMTGTETPTDINNDNYCSLTVSMKLDTILAVKQYKQMKRPISAMSRGLKVVIS